MLNALCDLTRFGMCEMRTAPKSYGQGLTTQLLRIMKLSAIFLLAACLTVSAKGITQKVTLRLKDAQLEKVFAEIKKQTGYSIFYNYRLVEKAKPVTLSLSNVSIEEAMKACLEGQPLDFEIADRSIVIKEKPAPIITEAEAAAPAFETITGVVTDTSGKPLAGATITIKGTKKAVVTDLEGRFNIDVKQGDVLVISYVGYKAREIKVGSEKTLRILIVQEIVEADEITISTGYQKISKERFVGSYSQLDSANFHRRAGMGIIDRLDGTVTGVVFDKKKGQFPIMVRGIGTLGIQNTNTQPLIVVDNFPMDERFDLNSLNPNDVESVTVLRDAAAASIWGTRAGNGVIVITTKKGRFNQPTNISVTSNVTVEEKPDLFYVPRISPSEFIDVERFLFGKGFYNTSLNTNWNPVSPVVEILARQRAGLISSSKAGEDIDALRQYDLRDDLNKYVYREAVRQQHFLNLSGGTNNLAYQFSLGYNRNLNNIQGSRPDDQITFNGNNTFRPTKELEFSTGVNFVYGIVKSTGSPIQGVPNPYERLADDNGKPLPIVADYRLGYVDTAGAGILLDWKYRPLDEIRFVDNERTSRFIRLNFGAAYSFTNWLKANVQYQFLNGSSTTRNFRSIQSYQVRNLINLYTNPNRTDNLRYPVPMGDLLDLNGSQAIGHNVRGTLNFNKSWNSDHSLNALIGGELSQSTGNSSAERLYGYNDNTGAYNPSMDFTTQFPRIYAAFNGSTSPIANSNFGYSEQAVNRIVSVLASASYSYKNRYNFYASARRDGANVFGVNTNNKWKPLWSLGGSWDISKENFYHVKWMPSLRLRGSYGYTGNVNNQLSGKFTMRYQTTPDFFSQLYFATAGDAPNPDLKWEEVKIVNAGVDFQLLNGRLTGSIDGYQKNASDVISTFPYPYTSGILSFTVNAASLRTRGFDVQLNSINTKGLFNWTTALGFSHAKTIVTKFFKNTLGFNRAQDFISYALNPTEGELAYAISSYRWAGLDPANGDPLGYLNGQVTKDYAAIFRDTIKNQVLNGSAIPLYSGFIRNDFSWKAITLSVNITGRFNYYYRRPALNLDYTKQSGGNNYLTAYNNRWQKPGDEAITNIPSMPYPAPGGLLADRNQFYQNAELHVRRGDNIRLQDIRLSYQWNNNRNNAIPVRSVQVFFYPNNLNVILWRMENDHYDPDIYGKGLPDWPTPKTWTVGINVNFK